MQQLTLADAQRAVTADLFPRVRTLMDALVLTVLDLDFGVRASKALTGDGRTHLWMFLTMSDEDLLKCENLGRKSLSEVKERLWEFGLVNGTPIADDLREVLEEATRMPPPLPPDPLAHIDAGWREQILVFTARRVGLGTLPPSALPKTLSPKVQRALKEAQQMRAAHPWAGVKS